MGRKEQLLLNRDRRNPHTQDDNNLAATVILKCQRRFSQTAEHIKQDIYVSKDDQLINPVNLYSWYAFHIYSNLLNHNLIF